MALADALFPDAAVTLDVVVTRIESKREADRSKRLKRIIDLENLDAGVDMTASNASTRISAKTSVNSF